ncbi:MAG: DUF1697 domain-containing protein [Sarcina sp.]
MRVVVLLRGVMPTGKNKIPKMDALVRILEKDGFKNVKTYIQSGNIILDSYLHHKNLAAKVHDIILQEIGADLSVIIKMKYNLEAAIKENPFDENYDSSRIHLVFTNDILDAFKIKKIKETIFDGEVFCVGSECFYMYLPRDANKKRLNNNYIEKVLMVRATTRKLSVINKLSSMLE